MYRRLWSMTLLTGAFLLLPGAAEAQTYDLTPGIDYILWDDGLGIEDTYLYGGRFGLTFGDFVSLQPFYFTRSNVEANPADIEDGEAFEGLPERDIDMRHVGASFQIEFARGGNVVPFIRAGGGILRLEPDGGERSDQITLEGGAGLRFGFSGLAAEIYAKDLAFSVNRYRLYSDLDGGAPFPVDEDGDDLRHNLTLGAGLRFGLGGQSGPAIGGRGGAAIPIEPFVGRLDYSDDLTLDDQNIAGLRAGLDFNELFGIRGYFWRGINDDFDDTDPVDSYGGEAQFNLNRGGGLSPYLVVGAGRLDFDADDAEEAGAVAPEDRTALILGGGLRFDLGWAGVNVAVRDYIFDASEEFEDVRSTDNLLHNPLFSAGLAFSVGGDRGRPEGRTAAADDPELERLREETVRLQREIEEVRRANTRLREQEPEAARPARVDTVVRYEERDREGRVIRDEVREIREVREREDAGRTVTIPIPPRGEVYFRYGEGTAAAGEQAAAAAEQSVVPRRDAAELRRAIRLALEEERARLEEDGGPISEEDILRLEQRLGERIERSITGEAAPRELLVVPTPADDGMNEAVFERRFAELERRLNDRIDRAVEREIERRVDQQLEQRLGQRLQENIDRRVEAEVERQLRLRGAAAEDEGTEELPDVVDPDTAAPDREGMPLSLDSLMDYWELHEVQPYAGANVDHPTQFVAGAQFDLGPATPGSPFDFIPEVAVGVGEDNPTVMLTANLRYMIGTLGQDWAVSPFLMAGGGIFSPTLLAFNLGYGAALDLGTSMGAPVRAFIQHQGINFFSRNRVLVGFEVDRWGR